MLQPTVIKKLAALPESLQTEVLHYIEFLLKKHESGEFKIAETTQQQLQKLSESQATQRYGYGSMAGQITVPDDFDDPLEELAEYM